MINRRVIWSTAITRGAIAASGIVLCFTAFMKMQDLRWVESVVRSHGLIPSVLAPAIAWGITFVELAVGAFALTGSLLSCRWTRVAGVPLVVLMASFTLYAFAMQMAPPTEPAPCGCGFSRVPIHDWSPVVLRNGITSVVLAVLVGCVPAKIPETGRARR